MIIRLQTKLICLLYKQEGYVYTTPDIKRPYTVEDYQASKLTKEEVDVLSIM